MSAEGSREPAGTPTTEPTRSGLGSLHKRVQSALRKSTSTPNLSAAPSTAVEEPMPSVPPSDSSASPAAPMATTLDIQPDEPNRPKAAPENVQEKSVPYKVTRQQLWEERARQLLDKYDLSMEPGFKQLDPTIDPTATVERVKKPVRMRVHRYCHRCEACFGPERICASCEHRRCKKCTRYPRESSNTRDGSRTRKARAKTRSEERQTMPREPLVVIQNPHTGGQILVHNRIVQRVQRSCHKCEAEFVPSTAKTCPGCGHARCSRCPRTPARLDTWKQAYPGDAEASSEDEQQQQPQLRHMRQERVFRKPRQRVRWNCDQCSTLFSEGQKMCQSCGHEKCENCRRHPLKRNRQEFDPDLVRSLNEKLSALAVTTSAS